jgi:hypothetical protein
MTNKQKLIQLQTQNKILGIDVSSVQGKIDWKYLETTYPWIKFVIVKAFDGKFIDSQFKNNWEGLGETNLLRCVYFVVHPNETSNQITALLNAFGEQSPHCVMIDFETSYINKNTTANTIKEEISMINDQLNVPTPIYSYYGFIAPFITLLGDVTYAIANYSDINPAHDGISDDKIILKQISGWVPANGCSGMNRGTPCRLENHDHGILLKLNANDPGTPTDIDIINNDDFWKSIQ